MARRATSLGPKPSLLICFCFCCAFPFFAFNRKKTCFPPRKGQYLFILECLALFLRRLFWPPPYSFSLSLSLSFYLSISLYILLFSFFLPSCLLIWFLLVPCFLSFFLFLSSSLLFHERNNIKKFNCICSILSFFLGGGVPVLLSLWDPFFLSLFFPDFQLCFLFNISVVDFKKHKLKNTNFWSKGGLQQNVFCYNLCFVKSEKLSFWGGHSLAIFGWCSKNTIQIGIQHIFKSRKWPFLRVTSRAK